MTLVNTHSTVEMLEDALQKKGYSFEHFTLDESSYTRFIAPNGRSWLTQDAHLGYPFSTKAGTKISSEKDLAYEFCAAKGIRIPRTFKLTSDHTDAEIAACAQHFPLVVKPHNASLSWGVALDIQDEKQLRAAIQAALLFSPSVLVQEQVDGEELRFTVVNGTVKAVLLREMPRLVGDGVSTIGELLLAENKDRAAVVVPYLIYPQLSNELIQKAGRSEDEVLPQGEVLQLGRGTMIRTGASVYNVLSEVHSSYLDTAKKLADGLGARFVVVDMMIHDHTQAQTDSNYAFIEFNTAPVLKLFYSCRDGKHYDILNDLVPMIDATLTVDYEQ